MISNGIEEEKELSLKVENKDEDTSDDDSNCESVESYDSDMDRDELTTTHVITSASNIRLKELN